MPPGKGKETQSAEFESSTNKSNPPAAKTATTKESAMPETSATESGKKRKHHDMDADDDEIPTPTKSKVIRASTKVKAPPKRTFLLKATAHPKDVELKQYMEENPDLHFPVGEIIVGTGDPRVLNARQYRDTIRMDLGCGKNGTQLRSIMMTHPLTKKNAAKAKFDDDILPELFDIYQYTWEKLGKALNEDLSSDKITIEARLEVLDKASNEPLMECRR